MATLSWMLIKIVTNCMLKPKLEVEEVTPLKPILGCSKWLQSAAPHSVVDNLPQFKVCEELKISYQDTNFLDLQNYKGIINFYFILT